MATHLTSHSDLWAYVSCGEFVLVVDPHSEDVAMSNIDALVDAWDCVGYIFYNELLTSPNRLKARMTEECGQNWGILSVTMEGNYGLYCGSTEAVEVHLNELLADIYTKYGGFAEWQQELEERNNENH